MFEVNYNTNQRLIRIMKSLSRQSQNHNNSNIRNTPDQKYRMMSPISCLNHPQKPVTHCLISSQTQEQLNYCQKCSIMLASQGFNVVKIKRDVSVPRRYSFLREAPKSNRQIEVEQFLSQLNSQIQTVKACGLETESALRASEEHYNNIISSIANYYEQLKNTLEIQKFITFNKVLTLRTEEESELRMLREELVSSMEELLGIGNDIQNNMEAAQSVEQEVYQTIMQNYRNKLEFSYEVQNLQIAQISKPILTLPQIPKVLQSLADRFVFGEQQYNENSAIYRYPFDPESSRLYKKSTNSSRTMNKIDEAPKTSKILPNIIFHKSESSQGNQNDEAYSFDNNTGFVRCDDSKLMRKTALFTDQKNELHIDEVPLRESLNLTEIRENEEYNEAQNRQQFSCLEETIPEEMLTSRESIAGYLVAQTLGYSLKLSVERDETDTLLIS